MKPLGTKNYGSIPHLSNSKLGEGDHYIHDGQERILTERTRDKHDHILTFEKYDGSNLGIAKVDGRIVALTRAGHLGSTSPFEQHHHFSQWVAAREGLFHQLLFNGERLVGEWLMQAHGLIYSINVEPIVFFDLIAGKDRMLYKDLVARTHEHGLPLPRLLREGGPVRVETLLPILNARTVGMESVDPPEGIVYRLERQGEVDFLDKWVRADFPTGLYCIGVDEKDLIWHVPRER